MATEIENAAAQNLVCVVCVCLQTNTAILFSLRAVCPFHMLYTASSLLALLAVLALLALLSLLAGLVLVPSVVVCLACA